MECKAVFLEETHLPICCNPAAWPLPWSVRWCPPVCMQDVAPHSVLGSLNHFCKHSGLGTLQALTWQIPFPILSSPQAVQAAPVGTRQLPLVHPAQDSLEKWFPGVSHHSQRATPRDLLPSQPPLALLQQPRALGPGQPHGAALT